MASNPNLDFLYLHDMLSADHPAYEMVKQRFARTPEGRRIEEFQKENDQAQDGLNIATHNKLDNIVRNENVPFDGEAGDRIGKIRAIRLHRSRVEDDKIKRMTTEEREQYLKDAEAQRAADKAQQEARIAQSAEAQRKSEAKKAAARTQFEEQQYQASLKRKKQQDKNQAFLDAELSRRKDKVNPVVARQKAIEERERKEKELAEAAEQNDADSIGTKLTKEERALMLNSMQKTALDTLMTTLELPIKIGMTNLQKVDVILATEYPAV